MYGQNRWQQLGSTSEATPDDADMIADDPWVTGGCLKKSDEEKTYLKYCIFK